MWLEVQKTLRVVVFHHKPSAGAACCVCVVNLKETKGNSNVIILDHRKRTMNSTFVRNFGHFDNAVDSAGLEGFGGRHESRQHQASENRFAFPLVMVIVLASSLHERCLLSSRKLDDNVAKLHLPVLSAKLTVLTQEHARFLLSRLRPLFKRPQYRY